MVKPTFIALVAAALLAGCASPPKQMGREEYLASTTRIYRVPQAQAISAAERVLQLADGEDVKFAHTRDGFMASRWWGMYMVIAASFGTDYWSVKVSDQAPFSLVEVQVGTSAQAVAPMATTSPGTWTATSLPGGAMPIVEPALYELFFARMDYLLGVRPDWPTCDWSNARVKSKATYGPNEALCNGFNMKDDAPDKPLVVAR